MNSEDLIKELVEAIDKNKAKDLKSYDERVSYWKREFDNKSALKWSDKIVDLEKQYLKSCLVNKKLLNCYEIKSLGEVDIRFLDKIIIWDDNISSMVVDALVIPASYDITDSKEKTLHDVYYNNGIRLRQKLITIMDGEKLHKNEVIITRSYGILADYIMHVNYDVLKESIINVMECARVNMVKTLVICLNNGLDDIRLVYSTIIEYLLKYDMMFDKVILSIKNDEIRDAFIKELNKEAK